MKPPRENPEPPPPYVLPEHTRPANKSFALPENIRVEVGPAISMRVSIDFLPGLYSELYQRKLAAFLAELWRAMQPYEFPEYMP